MRPNFAAALGLIPLGLMWLLAFRAALEVVHEALLPAIVWLAIFAAAGDEIARVSRFPVAYLYFAIPVWDILVTPLQFLSTRVAGTLVAAVGVPASIQGDFVQIPEGTFHIEGGCAGLGFLIVGLMLAALLGELNYERPRMRVLLLVLGAAFAIVSNWLRVASIILIGHVSDMQHPIVRDHGWFGWVIFTVMAVLLSLVASRLCSTKGAPARSMHAARRCSAFEGRFQLGIAATFLGVGIAPLWAAALAGRTSPPISAPLLRTSGTAWRGPAATAASWQPTFQGAELAQLGAYRSTRGSVEVYVAAYASQSQRGKLLGHFNSVIGDEEAEIRERSKLVVTRRLLNELEVEEPVGVGGDSNRWLLWYAYQIDTHTFASGISAQLWYAVASLTALPQSRVVALRAECSVDCSQARALLNQFVRENEWVFAPSSDEAASVYRPSSTAG